VTYKQNAASGGATCTRIDYAMDTAKDLDELYTAYQAWMKQGTGRTVEQVGTDRVRVTGCLQTPPNASSPL